jgi:hypothetical protein
MSFSAYGYALFRALGIPGDVVIYGLVLIGIAFTATAIILDDRT